MKQVIFLWIVTYSLSSFSAQVISLTNTKSKRAGFSAAQSLNENFNAAFGLSAANTFEVFKSSALDQNRKHERLTQKFNGVPIWGHQVARVTNVNGTIHRLHGHVVTGIDQEIQNIIPSITLDQAVETAKVSHAKDKTLKTVWMYKNIQKGLYIYIDKTNGKASLANIVSFFAENQNVASPSRPTYVLDAHNNKLLKSWDGLTHVDGTGPGGNIKTGKYHYGTDFGPLDVKKNPNGTCSFENDTVETVNLNHKTHGNKPFVYPCGENLLKEINGSFSPLNDAHFFGSVVFKMYKDWLNTTPLKSKLVMRVHYSNYYENAFWDGEAMTFGDGFSYFHPLVSLDVAAHEVSHGFTEQNSGLIYEGQSGGINEAFSDISGEAAEYFMTGKNDFEVGASIFKGPGALRYLHDPKKDGHSIDHINDYYPTIDVHYSSGLYNKAFHILATTVGWNIQKAFTVFAKANQTYWTPETDFVQGAIGVRDATKDLGYSEHDVIAAFRVVGIEL